MLALPSVVFEPRFKGSIRNILYADDETGKPRRQEVMAYKVGFGPKHLFFFAVHACKPRNLSAADISDISLPRASN